jgi:hypothetical protein
LRTLLKTVSPAAELSPATVDDELGRFRVWARNIGAMATGTASMDYRVGTASYIRQNVQSLLEDLKQSLIEGFTILGILLLTR